MDEPPPSRHGPDSGNPEVCKNASVNVVKLGKKGRVSIPRSALRALGIEDEQMMTVEISDDGAIVLRPAGVYPLELYDDARIAEFLAEDEMPADLEERTDAHTAPPRD